MKRRRRFRQKGPLPQTWLDTNLPPAFRGYPVATVAFYGPNDKLATKVVVSVILTESNDPDVLHRWFSEGDLDVRYDSAIGEQILAFLKPYAPRSTVVTDGISAARTKKARTTRKELLAPNVPTGPDVTASPMSVFSEQSRSGADSTTQPALRRSAVLPLRSGHLRRRACAKVTILGAVSRLQWERGTEIF